MTDPLRIGIAVTTGALGVAGLRRAVASAASLADLPLDALQDAVLIAETLVAVAGPAPPPLVLEARPGALRVGVGPLPPGEARLLLDRAALPLAGRVIEALADRALVRHDRGGETLEIQIAARARG